MKTIGVLALQGDFDAHRKALERAAQEPLHAIEVRTAQQLTACDALILPGGESTTMLKLLEIENLTEPLKHFGESKPIFGTCAGAILLAREVTSPAQPSLALMDIAVERNAYGRQLDSHVTQIQLNETLDESNDKLEAVFIRAPIIRATGPGVKILASSNGTPVWVEQGRHMVTTFHPELTTDPRVHRHFIERI